MENTRKYHGYLAWPRQTKLLRQCLGYRLYHYYLELVQNAIWHRDNTRIGQVLGTQADIATLLGIDQSTISRMFDDFDEIDKHLVARHKRYIILGYFPLFLTDVASKIASGNYATMHELYAAVHKINAELQEKYVKSQESRDQNRLQRLYRSSKDISGSFVQQEYSSDDLAEDFYQSTEEERNGNE